MRYSSTEALVHFQKEIGASLTDIDSSFSIFIEAMMHFHTKIEAILLDTMHVIIQAHLEVTWTPYKMEVWQLSFSTATNPLEYPKTFISCNIYYPAS